MHGGAVACVNAGGGAFIALAVVGVADLLGCMHALLRAGCRTGGLGENMCMPDITVYNPGITTYIGESEARNGSAAFDSSSCSSWTGVPIRLRTGLQGDARSLARSFGPCTSSGAITHCRDADESAGTAQAGHRAWHPIQVCSHDAPSTYPSRARTPNSESLATILIL